MHNNKRNYIFIAILLIGMTVYTIMNGITSITIKPDDNNLTVNGPDNTQCSLAYKDIVAINFIEKADYAAFQGGSRKGRYMYKSWECQDFGTCQLFIDSKIGSYIVVSSQNQTILLNFENDATTKSLYTSLTDFWQKHRN